MGKLMSALNPKIVVEFKNFLLKTNMFALATAVVLGGAINAVVGGIVSDLIMPVVGVVFPPGEWSTWTLKIWRLHFPLGHFFAIMLNFVIIAAVIFLMTKFMIKAEPPPPPVTPTKVCPQCQESIHLEAKRCKFCTSPM